MKCREVKEEGAEWAVEEDAVLVVERDRDRSAAREEEAVRGQTVPAIWGLAMFLRTLAGFFSEKIR